MTAPVIWSTAAERKDGYLRVSWETGPLPRIESLYPYLWLRDSCQCHDCFQISSKGRLFLMKNLDLNLSPEKIQINPEKSAVQVTWSPDGHVSCYDSRWLWDRHLEPKKPEDQDERPIKTWGSEMQENIPRFSYDQLLADDNTLYRWLVTLAETGLCVVMGAPLVTSVLDTIAARVSYLRSTNHGRFFTVKYKPDPSNPAYSTRALGLHTDLAYYQYSPGMQMLHCLKQADIAGGENEFADGIHVARRLQQTDLETFAVLTTTPINFTHVGEDFIPFHLSSTKPTIQLDHKGKISSIAFSNHSRNSRQSLSPEDTRALMMALRRFEEALQENIIRYKMSEGDIVCFNNVRVLHGRTEYTSSASGERHLVGGYLDWDELRSRLRVLEAAGTKLY